MPAELPKYLIKLIPQFEKSLRDKYPDHATLLKFDTAAQTAVKLIKEQTGVTHKIDASDIRRLVRYMQSQGAPIGMMPDSCYWAFTQAELSFSIGYIASRKKWYSDTLDDLEKTLNQMELV